MALWPFQDDPGYGHQGAMCALAGHVTGAPTDDVVVVTHNSGRILIYPANP